MEYQDFVLHAFEREPGKWRARVRRADGRQIKAVGAKLNRFITSSDAQTAVDALLMAMTAIDAAFGSRDKQAHNGKFARHRAERAAAAGARARKTPPRVRRARPRTAPRTQRSPRE